MTLTFQGIKKSPLFQAGLPLMIFCADHSGLLLYLATRGYYRSI